MNRGIITIAQGKKQYIDMAKQLAISLNISNPGLKKAIATDSNDPELKELYDVIVPTDNSIGIGIVQKLYMYDYSPFDETMFIDVDSMVLRNLDFLWNAFGTSNSSVSVIGKKQFDGSLFDCTIKSFQEKLGLEYVLAFNGGTYYFKKSETGKMIFDKAKELLPRYDELGIIKHRGNINEEPLMALALGIYKQTPIDDKGMGMYTPVGQHGKFVLDVLNEKCEFVKNGQRVSPAIMHFGFGHTQAFHYKREAAKLKLVHYYRFPKAIAGALVNIAYNPIYVVNVFIYRMVKSLFGRAKFKLLPVMPMFRFE